MTPGNLPRVSPCAPARGAESESEARRAVDRTPAMPRAAQEGVALIDSFFCSLDTSQSTDAGYQWP